MLTGSPMRAPTAYTDPLRQIAILLAHNRDENQQRNLGGKNRAPKQIEGSFSRENERHRARRSQHTKRRANGPHKSPPVKSLGLWNLSGQRRFDGWRRLLSRVDSRYIAPDGKLDPNPVRRSRLVVIRQALSYLARLDPYQGELARFEIASLPKHLVRNIALFDLVLPGRGLLL